MAVSTATDRGPEIETETEHGKIRSAESKAWRATVLQKLRKGSPVEMQEALADLEAQGHIVRDDEWSNDEGAELESEDAMDAELDLSDEDESFVDGDENPSGQQDATVKPSGLDRPEQNGVEWENGLELVVVEGICSFQQPTWVRFRSATKFGQDSMDDIDRKFTVLDRIAEWLNKHRPAFLLTPDPWLLGCDALTELRGGYSPVSPGDFIRHTEIVALAGDALFSRYTTGVILAWEDGTLPLGFLFGRDARMAWVANAVSQFAAMQKTQLTAELLERFQHITVPKQGKAKTELLGTAVGELDFGQFIARANLMAATKWSDVLAAYQQKLLQTDS